MALLLTEMMACRKKSLSELVDQMLEQLGTLEYDRRDLNLSNQQKEAFLAQHTAAKDDELTIYQSLFEPLGERLTEVDHSDGIMLRFASDAWLLARPSGTEPLVRVYAEAPTTKRVQELLDIGCKLAEG
jgi:phosphomannomutase